MLGVQLQSCCGWSKGGIPISPIAVHLRCYSPWCWFCCLGLCCELGHGKDPRQKRGERGEKGFLCFVFQQCCLLAENCVDTTKSGEPWCGGGSYLHQLSCQCPSAVQLYSRAEGAFFHRRPEALQTDHAFSGVL